MINTKYEMKKFITEHWLICLITLIAGMMRFYALSGKSFWVDEVIASLVSSKPLDRIFMLRVEDVSPPFRDYLAHFMFAIFGKGEFALRFPSAFFGTLSIPLLYFIGMKWFHKSTGIIAAILLTISPYFLHHSQDGRMYPMFIFFSISGFILLLLALEKEQKTIWYWVGFIFITALNIYTTYFAFWALISQLTIAIMLIIWRKITEKRPMKLVWLKLGAIALCLVVILILYLPWLPVLGGFISKHIHAPLPYKYTFTVTPQEKEIADNNFPFRARLGWQFIKDMIFDYGVPNDAAYFYLFWFIIGLIIALYRSPKFAWIIILWILIPLVILFAPPTKVLFFTRYISFIMPIYLIGIAYGISAFSEYWCRPTGKESKFIQTYIPYIGSAIILFLFILFTIMPIKTYYQTEKQNWRGAVSYLAAETNIDDAVLVGPYNAKWCVLYYFPQKRVKIIEKINTVEGLERICAENPRVWFITAYYRYYEFRQPEFFDWLEQHCQQPKIFPGTTPSDTIYVFQYGRK